MRSEAEEEMEAWALTKKAGEAELSLMRTAGFGMGCVREIGAITEDSGPDC